MTHMRQMADGEGTFGEWELSNTKCPQCGSLMYVRVWESNDGAYEDEKYQCQNTPCMHSFWVDGIDS